MSRVHEVLVLALACAVVDAPAKEPHDHAAHEHQAAPHVGHANEAESRDRVRHAQDAQEPTRHAADPGDTQAHTQKRGDVPHAHASHDVHTRSEHDDHAAHDMHARHDGHDAHAVNQAAQHGHGAGTSHGEHAEHDAHTGADLPQSSAPVERTAGAHAGHLHNGDATHEAHAAHAPSADRDRPADAEPRTPFRAITDVDRRAAFPQLRHRHSAHDREIHSYWLADRFEWQHAETPVAAWEGLAWIGGDVHRLWLRTEGEVEHGDVEHAHVEALYGRSVTAFWDVVAGVRVDAGQGPSRTWAALGVQGLAPYKFEVDATVYLGASGRSMATLGVEYETLITGRLVLQWQAEAAVHGDDDLARGIAAGPSSVEAGARLRYEITRRFAPYVGLQWQRSLGDTADLRRAAGEDVQDTRLVAGLRFWF